MTDHPIRRADVQAAVERWTELLLAQTGTGEIEVVLRFNCKDRRFLGMKLGGTSSRQLLEGAGVS